MFHRDDLEAEPIARRVGISLHLTRRILARMERERRKSDGAARDGAAPLGTQELQTWRSETHPTPTRTNEVDCR
jgi:hypothetical protein